MHEVEPEVEAASLEGFEPKPATESNTDPEVVEPALASEREILPAQAEVEFQAARWASLRGQVLDDEGQPIDEFEITGWRRDKEAGIWEELDFGVHTAGQFALEELEAGLWRFQVTHARYLPSKKERARLSAGEQDSLEFVLTGGAFVVGQVLTPNGEGHGASKVTIKTKEDEIVEEVDGEGRFHLVIEPGAFACFADSETYAASDEMRGGVRMGETAQVDLHLRRGGRLVGVVQDAEGRARPEWWVFLYPMGWTQAERTLQVDGAGRFVVEALTPGTYWVSAHRNQEATRGSMGIREVVVIEDGETSEVVLGQTDVREVVVSGTVYVGGEPSPDRRVWGGLNDPTAFSRGTAVSTDEKGAYRMTFAGPGPGYFLVIFAQQEYALIPITVGQGPTQEFDIHTPNGLIGGRVLQGSDPPERRPTVLCMPEGFGPAMTRSLTRRKQCEPDGSFRFENLTPGVYRVQVANALNASSVRENIEVRTESRVENLELQVGGAGEIQIQVVDAQDFPVEGAYVFAVDSQGMVHHLPVTGRQSEVDGKVAMDGLALADYRFFAQTDRAVSPVTAAIKVDEDREQTVRLVLRPGGHLTFQYPDGLEPSQALIRVRDGSGIDFSGTLLAMDPEVYVARGEAHVRHQIGPLPPGSYTVRLHDFGGKPLKGKATVREGGSTAVKLTH